MKTNFELGKVLKSRGLKGEFKVEIYSSEPGKFLKIKTILIDNKPFEVEKITSDGSFCYFKVKGIDSIEQSDLIKNKSIFITREQLPKQPTGKYYIADIIGCEVYSNGDYIGTICDIQQYGSADVYEIKTNDSFISFPAIKDVFNNIDIENCKIILNDSIFSRIAVYDNK